MAMVKRLANLKDFQLNNSKYAINSICSRNLDRKMCVTYPSNVRYIEKKSTLKSKWFLQGMFILFYIWSLNVSFIIYSVQSPKIAYLYDNSRCMKCSLHNYQRLTHSTDSNLYILSDGIGVLSLNFMSMFLQHTMSLLRGQCNILCFSMKDTLYINQFSSSGSCHQLWQHTICFRK